jgi:sporulation protein YlmC with PRC-barrel domain
MWLTEVRGRTVIGPDGRPLGTVRDVVVALQEGDQHPSISRLLSGSRKALVLIDREDIAVFDETTIALRPASQPTPVAFNVGSLRLGADELLLVRDVLDTQIVDISGHRLARVADVVFSRHGDRRWRIDAVDVSFARVLHRLHLSFLAHHLDEQLIDWSEIHLTSPRGNDVQLDAQRSAVHRVSPAELAVILERLDTARAIDAVEMLANERVAEAIIAGHHATGERLLRSVPTSKAQRIIEAMPSPHGEHWRARLDSKPTLQGRRFHRLRGWRRHGPPSGMRTR